MEDFCSCLPSQIAEGAVFILATPSHEVEVRLDRARSRRRPMIVWREVFGVWMVKGKQLLDLGYRWGNGLRRLDELHQPAQFLDLEI